MIQKFKRFTKRNSSAQKQSCFFFIYDCIENGIPNIINRENLCCPKIFPDQKGGYF